MAGTPSFIAATGGRPPVAVTTALTGGLRTATPSTAITPAAGAGGARFDGASIFVRDGVAATTTLCFYYYDNSATAYFLIGEFPIPQQVTSTGASSYVGMFRPVGGPVYLEENDRIYCAPLHGTCTYNVLPYGGGF